MRLPVFRRLTGLSLHDANVAADCRTAEADCILTITTRPDIFAVGFAIVATSASEISEILLKVCNARCTISV